jgi:hypothetical protein
VAQGNNSINRFQAISWAVMKSSSPDKGTALHSPQEKNHEKQHKNQHEKQHKKKINSIEDRNRQNARW